MNICHYHNKDELEQWLETSDVGAYEIDETALVSLHDFVYEKWCQRAIERNQIQPEDLSYSCKFSSLFIKMIFGGVIEGNEHHQYNVIEGKIWDLSSQSRDVLDLKKKGIDVYYHDLYFFANDEHLESLQSCMPRVMGWVSEYEQALINQNKEKNRYKK
jgi:hypothetical protein